MSWLRAIGGFFSGRGGQVIDDAIYTKQERNADDADYTKAAMENQAGGNQVNRSGFDVLVDCVSRSIRPGITIWLVGGISKWWVLPDMQQVDPFWANAFYLVLTFWFGGRALSKDLPKLLGAIADLRKRWARG